MSARHARRPLAAAAALALLTGARGCEPSADPVAGKALYAGLCARCHVAAPPRDAYYALPTPGGHTWTDAGALFEHVRSRMPHDAPGTLSDEAALALTAWLLERNGIVPPGRARSLRAADLPALALDRVVVVNFGPAP